MNLPNNLIITSRLAIFVAVYCEYKGGNTEIASLFNNLYKMFPDKEKIGERENILSKYHFIEIGKRLDIFRLLSSVKSSAIWKAGILTQPI